MHTVKGIAMADSIPHLKAYAYGITDLGKTNSDGVTKYLIEHFNLKI